MRKVSPWLSPARKSGRSDRISSVCDTSSLSPPPCQIPPRNTTYTSCFQPFPFCSPLQLPLLQPSSDTPKSSLPSPSFESLANPRPAPPSPGNATTNPALPDPDVITGHSYVTAVAGSTRPSSARRQRPHSILPLLTNIREDEQQRNE